MLTRRVDLVNSEILGKIADTEVESALVQPGVPAGIESAPAAPFGRQAADRKPVCRRGSRTANVLPRPGPGLVAEIVPPC